MRLIDANHAYRQYPVVPTPEGKEIVIMADFAKADEAAWARALQALEMNGNSLLDWIRIDFDELGTEQESLRLQMAMDRMSKFMSTLSNLMKKLSDTDESIAQNLK